MALKEWQKVQFILTVIIATCCIGGWGDIFFSTYKTKVVYLAVGLCNAPLYKRKTDTLTQNGADVKNVCCFKNK